MKKKQTNALRMAKRLDRRFEIRDVKHGGFFVTIKELASFIKKGEK